MDFLLAFIYILIGIAVFSAILYVALKSYARSHPHGVLAQPHGVRDVWLSQLGGFIPVIGFGVLFLILDAGKQPYLLDVSSYCLFTLVGGLFVGPFTMILVARSFYMSKKESVLQDIGVYRIVLFSSFGGLVLIMGIVILIFWLLYR